jgi:hypothetical protein
MSEPRLTPDDLRWTCHLCKTTQPFPTIEDVARHLAEVHAMQPERWPDDGLVIDASDVPELAGDADD